MYSSEQIPTLINDKCKRLQRNSCRVRQTFPNLILPRSLLSSISRQSAGTCIDQILKKGLDECLRSSLQLSTRKFARFHHVSTANSVPTFLPFSGNQLHLRRTWSVGSCHIRLPSVALSSDPTRSKKIACWLNLSKNRPRQGHRWWGRSRGCGYTRCLVHHPGKPLLCPPVSVLRIDTRIQQAVPPLKSAARYCITVLCRIKHVIRYAL